MREWARRVEDTHYVLGSVMGPHPFPTIVRDMQSIIGREVKKTDFRKRRKAARCFNGMYWRRQQCHRTVL